MTDMIPILEVTSMVPSFPSSHKHLKRQELVHYKRVYNSAVRPSLHGDSFV